MFADGRQRILRKNGTIRFLRSTAGARAQRLAAQAPPDRRRDDRRRHRLGARRSGLAGTDSALRGRDRPLRRRLTLTCGQCADLSPLTGWDDEA
jgi:hypothetical protein